MTGRDTAWLAMNVSASAAPARLTTERGQQGAAILLVREIDQAPARQTARLEYVARPIQKADNAYAALPVRQRDLIGERAPDAPEPKQHDIGGRRALRPAASDLRQLERRMDAAGGFGGVLGINGE